MTNDEKIAALTKRIEELEAKSAPPAKPAFVPPPYQRYDPTEGMRMPPSALQAMVGHPCNQVMAGVIQDRHAPNSPGMIPASQQASAPVPSSSTPGYVDPRPLGPQPGIFHVDAQLIADEVRKRKLGG
jgi:hypothetical protein